VFLSQYRNLAPLRSAIGMMECWNNGILGLKDWGLGKKMLSFSDESIDK
jgi:hypothetical protein